jgi:hypothetical protein
MSLLYFASFMLLLSISVLAHVGACQRSTTIVRMTPVVLGVGCHQQEVQHEALWTL